MSLRQEPFGDSPDGHPVVKSTLTNSHGHHVAVMNWGASLLDVRVPDRRGQLANVNAVFDSLDRYIAPHPGFGSSIGRFCNRIHEGRFTIDGREHQVTVNHGKHCLHGGKVNFSHKFWSTDRVADADGESIVRYRLVSPDGDEGFPGELTVMCEYRFNDADELTITFTATTTAATHVNLTNHSYWNLGGIGSGSAMDHIALIHSGETLAVDEDLIPTGATVPVESTPFDFLHPRAFADRLSELPATKGYDHCYIVAGSAGVLRPAAQVTDPKSGRTLEIETTQPAMQLYTANHLGGGESNAGLGAHQAFCMETQHAPDAPRHAHFASTLLRPGQTLRETTVHRFGVSQDG